MTHRHILTSLESIWWWHINPSIRRWKRSQIQGGVADAAIARGCGQWEIYGQDEEALSEGVVWGASG